MKRTSPLDGDPANALNEAADPVDTLMKLLKELPDAAPAPAPEKSPVSARVETRDVYAPTPVQSRDPEPAPQPAPTPEPAAPRPAPSKNRVKTTFLGFEHASGDIEDTQTNGTDAEGPAVAMYPAGWLVITSGPGMGAGMPVFAGVSQIGRGDDQTVQLNFGDGGVSRSGHAVVAYDPEARQFYLGHGGKSNLVRKNGMPVLSTEPLMDGDEIRISETTLRFKALCGADFCWSDKV